MSAQLYMIDKVFERVWKNFTGLLLLNIELCWHIKTDYLLKQTAIRN